MKRPRPRCILTIAGSDSGGGAGIQADARTIEALGGFALTAVTAITAQNTRGITAWRPVSPAMVEAQIDAVLTDFEIVAVKTGLLPGVAVIRAVMRALAKYKAIPLVIDPVIGSTSGTRFLNARGIKTLVETLLLRATLITPNWPEAAALAGQPVTTFAEADAAGRTILALSQGRCAVLVKGGHATGQECRDLLVTAGSKTISFSGRRIATPNTHGTGCVLSAAIGAHLGQGEPLAKAIQKARDFLRQQLRVGKALQWAGGVGPAFPGPIHRRA